MRDCNIPINGSFFCIEEVQLTCLVVLAVPVKDMPKFMGLEEWEVKKLLASSCNKIGCPKSPQLAYRAQDFGFTRTGLFNGQPLFNSGLMRQLKKIAPWAQINTPPAI